jgi:hypothetical protein
MEDPDDTVAMFTEMGQIGVPMLLIIVAAWAVMVFVANKYLSKVTAGEVA